MLTCQAVIRDDLRLAARRLTRGKHCGCLAVATRLRELARLFTKAPPGVAILAGDWWRAVASEAAELGAVVRQLGRE